MPTSRCHPRYATLNSDFPSQGTVKSHNESHKRSPQAVVLRGRAEQRGYRCPHVDRGGTLPQLDREVYVQRKLWKVSVLTDSQGKEGAL